MRKNSSFSLKLPPFPLHDQHCFQPGPQVVENMLRTPRLFIPLKGHLAKRGCDRERAQQQIGKATRVKREELLMPQVKGY